MTVFEVLPWITTITAAPILFIATVVRGGGVRMSLRAALLLLALTLLSVGAVGAAWTMPEVGWVVALQAVTIVVNVATVAVALKQHAMSKDSRNHLSAESSPNS